MTNTSSVDKLTLNHDVFHFGYFTVEECLQTAKSAEARRLGKLVEQQLSTSDEERLENSASSSCETLKACRNRGEIPLGPQQSTHSKTFSGEKMVKLLAELIDPNKNMQNVVKLKNDRLQFTRGMFNLGNTCFANAVLQCLVRTPRLKVLWSYVCHIFEGAFSDLEAIKAVLEETPILYQLSKLAVRLMADESELDTVQLDGLESDLDSIGPDAFLKSVEKFFEMQGFFDCIHQSDNDGNPSVTVYAPQMDAHEFMGWLLDQLTEEQLSLFKLNLDIEDDIAKLPDLLSSNCFDDVQTVGLASRTLKAHSQASDNNSSWVEVSRKGRVAETQTVGSLQGVAGSQNNYVNTTFQGILRSVVKKRGSKESITFEPFNCIPLEVANPRIESILDSLSLFISPESLSGLRKGTSSELQDGQKTVYFESLPPTLVFGLKRFVYNSKNYSVEKLCKTIGYPISLTIPKHFLAPTLSKPLGSRKKGGMTGDGHRAIKSFDYELYGVCLHKGAQASSGHYVSCVKTDTNTWLEIDDDVVTPIPTRRVLDNPNAYLLFYSRCG